MAYNPSLNRADSDFQQISKDATLGETQDILNKALNQLSGLNKFISIQSNMDGFIAKNVVIPATSSVKIQHFLGVTPKWRIILRQTGNGVITDIPYEWTNEVISLFNNGAVEVILTVFIARE
jgi:hypothetical protein